jgi:hypothetical protein
MGPSSHQGSHFCPYQVQAPPETIGLMSYSEFLESAIASHRTAPDHDHVRAFLIALAALEESRQYRPSSLDLLATELAYDRALINLSLHIGIDTGPERFNVPGRERDRLHRAVAESLPALGQELYAAGLIEE